MRLIYRIPYDATSDADIISKYSPTTAKHYYFWEGRGRFARVTRLWLGYSEEYVIKLSGHKSDVPEEGHVFMLLPTNLVLRIVDYEPAPDAYIVMREGWSARWVRFRVWLTYKVIFKVLEWAYKANLIRPVIESNTQWSDDYIFLGIIKFTI